jgi:hypothetical protein
LCCGGGNNISTFHTEPPPLYASFEFDLHHVKMSEIVELFFVLLLYPLIENGL